MLAPLTSQSQFADWGPSPPNTAAGAAGVGRPVTGGRQQSRMRQGSGPQLTKPGKACVVPLSRGPELGQPALWGGQVGAAQRPPSSYVTLEGCCESLGPRVWHPAGQREAAPGVGGAETGAGQLLSAAPHPPAGSPDVGCRPEALLCVLLPPSLHDGSRGLTPKPPQISCSKAASLPQALRTRWGWGQAAGTVVEAGHPGPRPPARGTHQLMLLLHLGLPVLAPLVPLLQLCHHSLTPVGQGLLVLNQLRPRAGARAAALGGARSDPREPVGDSG